MTLNIIIAAALVMLTSLVGVLFVGRVARTFVEKRLSYLVSFSAGVFLVTAGALTLEVFEIYRTSLLMGIGFIMVGYALAWLLEWSIPETHHHHDPACGHGHGKGARKLMVGDAIHNIVDGIILVPAFMVSPTLGIAVTVSILIHEALQEVSEFFVLKQAGYSTKRALFLNFLTSATIFIGVALSFSVLATHELEGLLLAVSAGFFLHVVLHDLWPTPSEHETVGKFLRHLAVLTIGLVIMASVNYVLGESHGHGTDHSASEEEQGEPSVH